MTRYGKQLTEDANSTLNNNVLVFKIWQHPQAIMAILFGSNMAALLTILTTLSMFINTISIKTSVSNQEETMA